MKNETANIDLQIQQLKGLINDEGRIQVKQAIQEIFQSDSFQEYLTERLGGESYSLTRAREIENGIQVITYRVDQVNKKGIIEVTQRFPTIGTCLEVFLDQNLNI